MKSIAYTALLFVLVGGLGAAHADTPAKRDGSAIEALDDIARKELRTSSLDEAGVPPLTESKETETKPSAPSDKVEPRDEPIPAPEPTVAPRKGARTKLTHGEVLRLARAIEDVRLRLRELRSVPQGRVVQYVQYWASDEFVRRAVELYRNDVAARISRTLPDVAESTRTALLEGFVRSARDAFQRFSKAVAQELPHHKGIEQLDRDPRSVFDHRLFKERWQDKWPLWAIPGAAAPQDSQKD